MTATAPKAGVLRFSPPFLRGTAISTNLVWRPAFFPLKLALVFAVLWSGVTPVLCSETNSLPPLTAARQVRELPPKEAARGYPVRLRGVVTFHDWFLCFIQDATGGIYVKNFDPSVRPGTEVEVEGVTAPGLIFTIVTGAGESEVRLRVAGRGRWPPPLVATAAALREETYDSQWVSAHGIVRAVVRAHDGVMLDLISDGVAMRAAVPKWPQNWALPGYLRGKAITVQGVVASKRGSVADGPEPVLLCVPSMDLVAVAPEALASLFERPQETIVQLFDFQIARDPPLVRVYGQVECARPGLGFFIIVDGGSYVWVQTSAPGSLSRGDFVDAVGWLERFDNRPVLTDAYFRKDKPGDLPLPAGRKATELVTDQKNNNGAAIRVDGTLLEQQRGLAEDSLVVEDEGVVFLARLIHSGNQRLPDLEPGMRLRLGGTAVTKSMPLLENLPPTFAFQLWLFSPEAVEILQRPPWWTARHVLWLCEGTLLLTLFASIWIVLLRRQVAQQTAVIGSQLEREAVARERTRIARELHDSLGQELVGIALQLDSAAARLMASPTEAERTLTMARMMVRHSQAETKRSVADLRAEELDRTHLAAALEEWVQPLIATMGSGQFHMETHGTPRRLAGVMEHHLLRIGQEAVANAVRHAHARKITVRLKYARQEVLLEVEDDGRGFEHNEAVAIASGHFGLLGLRERANKLQGRLRIESRQGVGTIVAISILLTESPA